MTEITTIKQRIAIALLKWNMSTDRLFNSLPTFSYDSFCYQITNLQWQTVLYRLTRLLNNITQMLLPCISLLLLMFRINPTWCQLGISFPKWGIQKDPEHNLWADFVHLSVKLKPRSERWERARRFSLANAATMSRGKGKTTAPKISSH